MAKMHALGRKQLVLDAVLAAAVFAFTLAMLSRPERFEADRALDVLGGSLGALASWPLAVRRRATLAAFALVTGATSALYALGYGLGPPLGFAIALYTLAERRGETRPYAWTSAALASIAALLAPHVVRGEFGPELLLGAAVWTAAWFAGDRARLRRERLAELEERARRAEREAERERRLAAAEERTRIARDLHDSAGHAINVILVQAGAARLLQEREPQRAREALETIEAVARDTLGEIDQLVRALRDDGAPAAIEPPSGLAALGTLAERYRRSGLRITVTIDGSRRPLPPAVDQAAYRILQEALTNAARHGGGEADVRVAFGASAVDLTVVNPAQPGDAEPSGHGIIGMRERASLLGGGLEAEGTNGTFRVHAWLPYGDVGEPR